jgi:hypothetical protein
VVEVMNLEQVRVAALHLDEAMQRPKTAAVPLGLHRLQPGDHLAYSFVRAPGLEAWHHAIFLGEEPPRLIEVTGNGLMTAVAITSLRSFLECAAERRSPLLRIEYEVPQPRLLVLRRALWALGRWPFNMLTENCEHVATWAAQGVLISPQTSRLPLGEAQPARPVQPLQPADDEAAVLAFLGAISGAQSAIQDRLRSTREAAAATVENAGRVVQRSTRAAAGEAGRQLNALQARVTQAAAEVLGPTDGDAPPDDSQAAGGAGNDSQAASPDDAQRGQSNRAGPWQNLNLWLAKQQQQIAEAQARPGSSGDTETTSETARTASRQQQQRQRVGSSNPPSEPARAASRQQQRRAGSLGDIAGGQVSGDSHKVGDAGSAAATGHEQGPIGAELELELFGYAYRQQSDRGCVCRATGCRDAPRLLGGGAFCLIEAGCQREAGRGGQAGSESPEHDSGEAAGGWSVQSWRAAKAQLDRLSAEVVDSCSRDEQPRPAALDRSTGTWGFLPEMQDAPEAQEAEAGETARQ